MSELEHASLRLEPGQLIAGKYRIESQLGQGGMAQVVSAVHTELDQRFAIKTLLPEHAASATTVNRFLREAKAAARIRSDHVARVFDVGRLEQGSPYMVLELLDGTDLARWVEANGPLSVRDAVDAVIQACDAIAQAHAIGIVHRDLKPSNLFFTTRSDGTRAVKVIDFGISKQITMDASMTGTAEVFGSPQYMSPEQIRASRDVDGRTDIWALGVVLYELLTGEPPFTAESVLLLGGVILNQEPRPLAVFRNDVPAAVEATMWRCLRKTPDERFATAAEIADALLPFASEHVKALVGSMPRLVAAAPASNPDPFKQSDPSLPRLPIGPASRPSAPSAPSGPSARIESAGKVVVHREPNHSDTLGAAATQASTTDLTPKRGLATPLGAGLAAGGVTLVFGAIALIVYVARTPAPSPDPVASSTPATLAPPSAALSLPTLTSATPPLATSDTSVPAPSSQPSARPSATVRSPVTSPPSSARTIRDRGPIGGPPSVPAVPPVVATPATTQSPTASPAPTVIRDRHGGN
ncbi:MAG: protein kinase [Deltaproteobacteria bacterium]|nr:protein kinase [Deltaproteobacteria bacterium]